MTLEDAANILSATIDEIEQNAEFISTAMAYIADSSALVFAHDKEGGVRESLHHALKLRRTQPAAIYRGLIVQVVAAFEEYMRNFCTAQVDSMHFWINDNGNDLNDTIRLTYLSKAGKILGQLPSGTYFGARFDFRSLERSLPSVLSNERPIQFQPSVFSTRLGACSSEKITEIFSLFQLDGPFGKDLGAHPAAAPWRKGSASPTAASTLIQGELNKLVDLRNDLAHGALSSVTIDDVRDAGSLIRALGRIFETVAQVRS